MCFSTLTFSNFSTRRSEVTSAVKVSPFTLTAFDHFLPFSSGKSTPLKLGEKVQGCPLEFLVAASEAKVRGGSVDKVRQGSMAALRRSSELGMRPLAARCHLALGRLYAAVGDASAARECLEAALSEYRCLGMQYWVQHADADRADLQ
jgi:hypothetical protein